VAIRTFIRCDRFSANIISAVKEELLLCNK
jgi:hypothetical protein